MEVLKQYKGNSPMYDLNEALMEQMTLPLDVTFSDLKSQVREVGGGEWRVFHAPHLVGLSRFFFATVDPVQYRLEGSNIYSNVQFIHPILGTMWLSASGVHCIFSYHSVMSDMTLCYTLGIRSTKARAASAETLQSVL